MAGLKGLTKSTVEESAIDQFITGATQRVNDLKPSQQNFKRCTFSLDEETSIAIDELVVRSGHARVNRSTVIKTAIQTLLEMSDDDVKALFRK